MQRLIVGCACFKKEITPQDSQPFAGLLSIPFAQPGCSFARTRQNVTATAVLTYRVKGVARRCSISNKLRSVTRFRLPSPTALSFLLVAVLCSLSVAQSQSTVNTHSPRRFSTVGVDAHFGLNGIGFDLATPLTQHFNLRAGGDFFNYSRSFTADGNTVDGSLQLRSAHADLDWFPFHNGFHVSPMLVLANNNHVRAMVLVPAGASIKLNGNYYTSSRTNPLNGSGSVDFPKTSPGLKVGWGNIVPRSKKHFSFPVEVGFYYVGQPTLKIAFTGSICDPSQPESIGCKPVKDDVNFQKDLNGFQKRNEHNLSYASIFPVFSFGVGYRF